MKGTETLHSSHLSRQTPTKRIWTLLLSYQRDGEEITPAQTTCSMPINFRGAGNSPFLAFLLAKTPKQYNNVDVRAAVFSLVLAGYL